MNYQIIDGCKVYDLKDIEVGTELVTENVTYDEYEEEYESMEYDYELFEEDDDHQIWMTRGYLHFPEIHAKVHFVDYCNRIGEDEDGEHEYMADFCGWIFFHDETNEWLYEEGYSSFSAAIWNGFHRKIGELKCDIYL